MIEVESVVEVPLHGISAVPKFVSFTGLERWIDSFAVCFGEYESEEAPLVRLHSECVTGDIFGSRRCDCGMQLSDTIELLSLKGGVLLYLRQEGRGIGFNNKMKAYKLQDEGFDTFEANRQLGLPEDAREFESSAKMLLALGLSSISLISNNPDKAEGLRSSGIAVKNIQETKVHLSPENLKYLTSKKDAGHNLAIKDHR